MAARGVARGRRRTRYTAATTVPIAICMIEPGCTLTKRPTSRNLRSISMSSHQKQATPYSLYRKWMARESGVSTPETMALDARTRSSRLTRSSPTG